jgi:hypothetical protein
MTETLERDAQQIADILHVYGGPHASAAFRRIIERLIAKDTTDAEIVALVRTGAANPGLAPPWADARPLEADEIPLTILEIKRAPACACGTVEAWHNPGCGLYPEGGYPADQPWRGPPKARK